MILSFADKEAKKIWSGEPSRRLPGSIQAVARRKLRMLNNAASLDDLRIPPAIGKRGDRYLRTLLIHGARAVLNGAKLARKKDRPMDRTQAWALALVERVGHNKAAVALANKTARRLSAAQHHGTAFDPDHVSERTPR